MKKITRLLFAVAAFLSVSGGFVLAADAKAGTLTCVGLYSETSDGYVSYRAAAGKGEWIVVKVGDVIPAAGEIRINVERDWIEVRPSENPNAVYELKGGESGAVTIKVADILKGKARAVAFPSGTASKPDAKYKDKLVVTQYLGRQIFMTADGDTRDMSIFLRTAL